MESGGEGCRDGAIETNEVAAEMAEAEAEAGATQRDHSSGHGQEGAEGRGTDEAFIHALTEAVSGLGIQDGSGDEEGSCEADGNSSQQNATEVDGSGGQSRRSSAAPLGLVIEEEEECQSRGVWGAVRAGLVAPGSVLEGLREYCRVEVLDGDNMYACDECSRKFREQGRTGMKEARERRRLREAKGSSTEEEEAEEAEEERNQKEEAVRAEVRSPAIKQTLLWALPRFLVLNLKRFTQTVRGRMRKVDKFVTFPLRLDLSPFCHRESPVWFEKSRRRQWISCQCCADCLRS